MTEVLLRPPPAATADSAGRRRILLLAPSGGLGGGIERYLETVQRALEDVDVDIVRQDLVRAGRRLTRTERVRFVGRALTAAVRHGPFDCAVVAHPNLAAVGLAAAVAGRAARAPVVFYGTDIWTMSRTVRALVSGRNRLAPLTISTFSAGALSSCGVAGILPPSVTPAWRATLRRVGSSRPAPADRPTVITVFRLEDWRSKGLPELIFAVRRVSDAIGPVRLVVAGRGPAPADLITAAAEGGATLWVDPDDATLARLYGEADLSVLATRTCSRGTTSGEGYGIVLLEAQLAGCPVVGPASGGSRDAYQDGVTGWTPADESGSALAALLGRLLADRPALGAAGRRAAAWATNVTEPDSYRERVVDAILGDVR